MSVGIDMKLHLITQVRENILVQHPGIQENYAHVLAEGYVKCYLDMLDIMKGKEAESYFADAMAENYTPKPHNWLTFLINSFQIRGFYLK